MKKLNEIFTKDVIEELKNNKDQITSELLDKLRSYGNEGKQIALDILDFPKDSEQYYLDAFNNRITFDGNRRLKKEFTKLNLSEIHKIELQKCKEDIHYFKDNYVKIKTKTGVNFPDTRKYQDDFLDVISDDEIEDIVALIGRQSGKTITTAINLTHFFVFKKDLNIGIVSNRGSSSREFLHNTKNIFIELPVWMQIGVKSWNKTYIEGENGMRILTDVPSSDAFMGWTISVLVVDECAKIRTKIWNEFSDSIFPSQSALAWKKNIILSTMRGMNHYYEIVQGARNDTNGFTLFEVDWRDVPRYDGKGNQLSNEEFQKKIVDKHGIIYFNQNYGNEAVGSSHTLISADKLKALESTTYHEKRDGKLKIYHYPEHNHKYILSVDSAKDGTDAFAVQIVDITDFNFKQAACANLQIDYLLMPEFIHEWCQYYNNAFLIIENNEGSGQSIADQMYMSYEYENLYFDKKPDSNSRNAIKSKKSYPGFRTTTKTRKQILQTLKLFMENDKLEINDSQTIQQFFQFVLVNNKFQADEGAKDDMIMALAIIFAPFVSTKNFEDMKTLIKNIYVEDIAEEEKADMSDLLIVSNFDDGSDEEYFIQEDETIEFFNEFIEPFYSDESWDNH